MLSADQWREYAAQIEAVSDVPGYPFPVGPSAEDCLQVAALIEAARSALSILEADRENLFESCVHPRTGQVEDADEKAEIASYDAAIEALRALLPQTGEGEGTDRADLIPLPDAEAEALNFIANSDADGPLPGRVQRHVESRLRQGLIYAEDTPDGEWVAPTKLGLDALSKREDG